MGEAKKKKQKQKTNMNCIDDNTKRVFCVIFTCKGR